MVIKRSDSGSGLSDLQRKLARIKKEAPRDPDELTLDWMVHAYSEYRSLKGRERRELKALAVEAGMKRGDVVLRFYIKKTAASHLGDKQKGKYCRIFKRA